MGIVHDPHLMEILAPDIPNVGRISFRMSLMYFLQAIRPFTLGSPVSEAAFLYSKFLPATVSF